MSATRKDGRTQTCRRSIAAAAIALAAIALNTGAAAAFEYQTGPGKTCYGGKEIAAGTRGYGDMNLYISQGALAHQYSVPYNTEIYLWNVHHTYTSTNATAADAENYVITVGPDCAHY